jgi:tetratricopeptide (TPR) repeat protein
MKFSLKCRIALALVLLCLTAESRAQNSNTSAREAEWQDYKLPASNFLRYADSTKAITLRVPVEWKQQGNALEFVGPDAELKVIIETIPDGLPLKSYVTSLMQGLRGLPGGPDGLLVRRTQVSGVEAREFLFELEDANKSAVRRMIWTAVDGPRAVSFIFTTPLARAAEVEPYFKAVIQSSIISNSVTSAAFNLTHSQEFKENKPGRIDETLVLIDALDSSDAPSRAKAISSLSKIFANSPESAIDLLNDRRPMIRAAAVEAIELSKNAKLGVFLIDALDDNDSFAAERAAKAFAAIEPQFGKWLINHISTWHIMGYQKILRASVYLDEETRAQIVEALFKQASQQKQYVTPARPPIASKRGKAAPNAQARKSTSSPTTPPPPPDAFQMVRVVPPGVTPTADFYNGEQLLAINLLRNVSVARLKTPLAEIIARKEDRPIVAALQVALERRETLPVDSLFKLLSSPVEGVRYLASSNLARSASTADIPRIESHIRKIIRDSKTAVNVRGDNWMEDDLRVAIKKIRLREQLVAASGESRALLIKQALSDVELAWWTWNEYARDDIEGSRSKDAAASAPALNEQAAKPAVEVMPLGENVFPEKVTYYVALPNPSSALNKVGDAFRGLQMESARSQAQLVLMLSAIREQMAKALGAPSDGVLLDYLGIKSNAPIAFASWNAESAPRTVGGAERSAVVVRVSDRDRFEHVLALYQKQFGNFASLPSYVSIGARAIAVAPAVLPLSALSIMKEGVAKSKDLTKSGYNLIGRDSCLGHAVKVIERREITQDGHITDSSIYLAYVGGAAILAPDWYSLRDALGRLASAGPAISANAEFKHAVASGGDVIYLSSLTDLFDSSPAKKENENKVVATESGALKVSNETWENSFQFSFKESAWTEPLIQFHPSELSAPRDLLPRSSIIYYFMKADASAAWREWASTLFSADNLKQVASIWAMDFEKDVLTEIGPECGIALLGLPSFQSIEFDAPWLIFFKLKSDKLAQAFNEGKLLKDVSAGKGASHIKVGALDVVVMIKNGFLVFTGNDATIERLSLEEKLDKARDFTRAAKSVPGGVVAFGGYNLEAAAAEIKIPSNDPTAAQGVNALMSIAGAFHSQNFYATASAGRLDARMSVSLDREGRYSVEELSSLIKDFRLAYAVIEVGGVPIVDQKRLESLKLKIRAKAAGEIDRIKEDITSSHQATEKLSEQELILTVRPRHFAQPGKAQLPVSGAEFAEFLKPTRDIRSDDKNVITRAREIAGDDRNAWSVARKLSDWTYKNLKWKRVDDADAAETLATREADCSEFSQLFVAMARSLGLPARIVTGIAYGGGGSFGGHAWVEVYAGEWIELDPTYGTDFVDATHIRGSSSELISYAALNLVQVEALEAVRRVPAFQRDVASLAEKLCEELSTQEREALSVSLDVTALTDEYMGAGAWNNLNDRERDQMSAVYRKALTEISRAFPSDETLGAAPRLLKVTETADRAEALVMKSTYFVESLMRFKFARRGDVWMLTDLVDVEQPLHIISSLIEPAIQDIRDKRSGKKTQSKPPSAFERELVSLEDSATVVGLIDPALKSDPKNRSLRYIKAMALYNKENNEESVKLFTELSAEEPPYPAAVYQLAEHYQISEKIEDYKRAIELLERYSALEPYDPRPFTSLGYLHEKTGDLARAEASYLAAIEHDPRNAEKYLGLAQFLATQHRYADALAAMDKGERAGTSKDELYDSLLTNLGAAEEIDSAEALVAAYPERIAKNFAATLTFAGIRLDNDRAKDSLPLFKKAIELNPASISPHNGMATAYRKLKNWAAALAAADAALRIDAKSFEAHYHRACALAQLGRKREAMAALKRAAEVLEDESLDDVVDIEDEEDLKPLAGLAEFKKLIKKQEADKEKR